MDVRGEERRGSDWARSLAAKASWAWPLSWTAEPEAPGEVRALPLPFWVPEPCDCIARPAAEG